MEFEKVFLTFLRKYSFEIVDSVLMVAKEEKYFVKYFLWVNTF